MKNILVLCLALTAGQLLGASQARPQLVPFPAEEVDQFLAAENSSPGFPENLQGLWWMDGNPLPDEVVSFAHASFDAKRRFLVLEVSKPESFSFHNSKEGRFIYELVRRLAYTYEIQFNADFTIGTMTPVVTINGLRVHIPKAIADYSMIQLQDGKWLRKSKILGEAIGDHNFTRIVSGQGEREAAFASYRDYVTSQHPMGLIARDQEKL